VISIGVSSYASAKELIGKARRAAQLERYSCQSYRNDLYLN
jgi:hypothetical protein